MAIAALANPKRFFDATKVLVPVLGVGAIVLLATGFYWSLVLAPADYQQGDTARIMFVHVPAAWMSMFVYGAIVIGSLVGLVFRHPLADVAARAAAPYGAAFTALALITGSLWGKPMWGAYWVWDARLTSELILLFIYLAYIGLWNAIEDQSRAAKACAVLALVGAVNIPIIKFSVDWWSTLHQGESIFRSGGPTISADFLWPLFIMAAGYTVFFLWLWLIRIRGDVQAQRLRMAMTARA